MTAAPAAVEGSRPSHVAGAVRLLLGGRDTKLDGFLNVDLFEGPEVDVRTDVSDLSMFADGQVSEMYCSHVLEHFSHTKTASVLKEWRRVLARGAKAWIAVPDFDAMIQIFRREGLNPWIVNMLHGDQIYPLAYHYAAFTFATLAKAVIDAGFSDVRRVSFFPYKLPDCSTLMYLPTSEPVSLNVEATA